MATSTKIEWTNATWNPWHGCKKVSPGCKYCYMFRDKERYGQEPTVVMRSKSTFSDPLKWQGLPDDQRPRLVFTCSWSDFFIEEADQWRPEAWEIIRATPEITYQVLTKRPERVLDHLPKDWGPNGYPNVWLGVSVESQAELWRLGRLEEVPARVRFASFEPLIGPVSLYSSTFTWRVREGGKLLSTYSKQFTGKKELDFSPPIDWAIIGGESGNFGGKYKFRECLGPWIEELIEDCQKAKIPVFVKQLGTYLAYHYELKDRHGADIDEWPAVFQVRQMPLVYGQGV